MNRSMISEISCFLMFSAFPERPLHITRANPRLQGGILSASHIGDSSTILPENELSQTSVEDAYAFILFDGAREELAA